MVQKSKTSLFADLSKRDKNKNTLIKSRKDNLCGNCRLIFHVSYAKTRIAPASIVSAEFGLQGRYL